VTQEGRQQAIAGVALIALGLALYFLRDLGYSLAFFLVGGGFLVAYFYRKEFAFLVPGCIILGLGLGSLGADSLLSFDASMPFWLGCGFIAITAIALLYQRVFTWWPLIPGAILILLGLPDAQRIMQQIFDNWQLILVAIGVLIVIRAFARPKRPTGTG
jgi:hypothetical protein